MRLIRRIATVSVVLLVVAIAGAAVAGRFQMFGLSNLLAEIGVISPGIAGGIPIPTTSMSIRLVNLVVWVGLAGMVGAFFYVMVVSFEAYTAGGNTDKPGPGGPAAAKPAPGARPDPGAGAPPPPKRPPSA